MSVSDICLNQKENYRQLYGSKTRKVFIHELRRSFRRGMENWRGVDTGIGDVGEQVNEGRVGSENREEMGKEEGREGEENGKGKSRPNGHF